MLKKQREEIICLKFSSLNPKHNKLFKELTISKSDLIIDCSNITPKESVLTRLAEHQKKINKCFVIVISPEMQKIFINDFNFVPTKKEAYDFVYFEQLQRDLGY